MTTPLLSPLVGAFHRPPAKQVLAALPAGQGLELIPEPENPYDEKALKVCLWMNQVPEELHAGLYEALQGTGSDLAELLEAEEPLQLGYVAASGGKPLAKSGLAAGNAEFLAFMAAEPEHSATLCFGPAGEPRVALTAQGTGPSGIPEPGPYAESQDER